MSAAAAAVVLSSAIGGRAISSAITFITYKCKKLTSLKIIVRTM